MKINLEKLCDLYNEQVTKSHKFTLTLKRKQGKMEFNKELQTKVDELNELETWKFLSMVFNMFKIISEDNLEKISLPIKRGV